MSDPREANASLVAAIYDAANAFAEDAKRLANLNIEGYDAKSLDRLHVAIVDEHDALCRLLDLALETVRLDQHLDFERSVQRIDNTHAETIQ